MQLLCTPKLGIPTSCETHSVNPNLFHPCMQGKLPDWVHTLAGVAIPFGAFDAVLQDEVNADVSVDFVKAASFDGSADASLSNLESIKTAIQRLRAPESLRQQLREAFQEEGEQVHTAGTLRVFLLSSYS